MTSSLFFTLAIAAACVGALHALAPDHWLPIAVVSRARGWSLSRTGRVALACGIGHVTVSAVLALIALYTGAGVVAAFGAQISSVAAVLMIGFGITYALWGARHAIMRKLHGHSHDHFDHVHDPSKTSAWALFAIYSADACVAVIPIVFASAVLPLAATLAIIVVFELAAIGTMVSLAVVSRAGAGSLLRGRWIESYGDSMAGALIVVTGIAVSVFGI